MSAAWVTLCKRTEDPKLSYIERLLTQCAIPHKRSGESWHAPILYVPKAFETIAESVLAQPAKKAYGIRTRLGVSLDDVPDSHRDFRGYQPSDYIPECDGAPPCEECAACNDQEDPNDYQGMGWVGSDGRP